MLALYDGKCWICRTADAKVVDHCHQTGRIRGPLCYSCNTRLAGIESPVWVRRAQSYLGQKLRDVVPDEDDAA